MLTPTALSPASPIVYPESDVEPLADNGKQFRWIIVIAGNLTCLCSEWQAMRGTNFLSHWRGAHSPLSPWRIGGLPG
jgi:hypothetical protein